MRNKETLLSIGEASEMLGVSVQTLRNWEKRGYIQSERTPSGHRRYALSDIRSHLEDQVDDKQAFLYVRVSTKKQEESGNLLRQKERLMNYAIEQGLHIAGVYEDVASGLNENRKGLSKLLKEMKNQKVSYLIIEYKDRLARFGFSYLENHLRELGCEIIIAEEKQMSEEQELVDDLIAITTSFSARIYGKRGGKKVSTQIIKTIEGGVSDEDDSTIKT